MISWYESDKMREGKDKTVVNVRMSMLNVDWMANLSGLNYLYQSINIYLFL